VTADRKMEYQQRLTGLTFGVIVLNAGGTQLETLHSVAEPFREAVSRVQPGELIHVRWGCEWRSCSGRRRRVRPVEAGQCLHTAQN
jgi:hypothetical protein